MENLSQAQIYEDLQRLWPSCACAVVFLILLLWDVCKALNRRVHWVPGTALVLSALTIQMLGLIDYSDLSYFSSSHERNEEVAVLVREDQLLFDCARLMMCVFIGYLVPAMARSNWTSVWGDIGGLILTVMLHMAFEVYFVWKANKSLYWIPNRRESVWFLVSNTTLFTASLLLLILLSCAALAGKSIRSILQRQLDWALSCCSPPPSDTPTSAVRPPSAVPSSSGAPLPSDTRTSASPQSNPHRSPPPSDTPTSAVRPPSAVPPPSGAPLPSDTRTSASPQSNLLFPVDKCETTEEHVLKCWIVAHVCQPEYVMARSAFSSLAGVVVTIAVLILVVKWACIQPPLDYGIAHKTTVFIELAFILLGWTVVAFRWLTAVTYFQRKPEFLVYLEDFWTMSIVKLKADLDATSTCRLYKEKKLRSKNPVQKFILNLVIAVRLHSVLLPIRVWLQNLIVLLSKACWSLSQKPMGMIRPFLMNTQKRLLYGSHWRREQNKFHRYIKTLSFLQMPGEIADNLWIASEMAFKMTQSKMEQGITEGMYNTVNLIKLIKQKGASSSELKKKVETYFEKCSQKKVETYFKKCSEMSHKKRGVSLMWCMIHFYAAKQERHLDDIEEATNTNTIYPRTKEKIKNAYKLAVGINDALEAYSEAWDFLDFVDKSDEEAVKDFDNLRNMWEKFFQNLKELEKVIEPLPEEDAVHALENWRGSKDWMRLTVYYNSDCKDLYRKLYSTFKSVGKKLQQEDVEKKSQENQGELAMGCVEKKPQQDDGEFVRNLKSLLADVIEDCRETVLDKEIIKECNKWAKDSDEQAIYRAAFIAGKAKGVRYKIGDLELREKTAGKRTMEEANGYQNPISEH